MKRASGTSAIQARWPSAIRGKEAKPARPERIGRKKGPRRFKGSARAARACSGEASVALDEGAEPILLQAMPHRDGIGARFVPADLQQVEPVGLARRLDHAAV